MRAIFTRSLFCVLVVLLFSFLLASRLPLYAQPKPTPPIAPSSPKPIAPTPTPRPSPTATPAGQSSTATPTRRAPTPTPPPPPVTEKVLYLTFDDGPSEWTQPIMDLLAQYNARATFFVLGVQAAESPDMIQTMYEAGHGIANHTWKHANLEGVSRAYFNAEIEDTADAIGDYESKCLRPPYGARNQNTYTYAEDLGYDIALWSIDPGDWRRPGANAIAQSVLSQLHNRAVILMHDGGGDRSQTLAALEILLPQLTARGYELRAVCREDPMPQVGDYLLGIPSELEIGMAAAEPTLVFAPVLEMPAASIGTGTDLSTDIAAGDILGDSIGALPDKASSEETEAEALAHGGAGRITYPAPGAVVRGRILIQGYVNSHENAVEADAQGDINANSEESADADEGANAEVDGDAEDGADTDTATGANPKPKPGDNSSQGTGSENIGSEIISWHLQLVNGEETLEIGSGEPTNHMGALGVWDTREVANGQHILRLDILHANGEVEQQIVDVTVRN